uniref:Reverse transcriptase domain-containing protein n=1 Tax=Tanacetum cinerariifolium TaxID=118510 RepID=A0A6L2JHU4_TANCI|nr:reverse transcriptase domain-containing protein [Tanacetum cinerariifolium]
MASFFQMNTASTSRSGSLPRNTVANPKGELKAITTRSGIVLDGPSVPTPPLFINPREDERVDETLTDQDLSEYTIKVPPPPKIHKALLSNKEKLQELANTPLNENCSTVILKKLPEKLKDPGKFLIPYGFSELKYKALADLGASINLMPLSIWKKLGLPELISTRMTLELANRAICTPAGIARDVFVSFGKFTFPADFVIVDHESDPRVPLILGRPFLWTARALIDVHGEEMILRDEGGNVLPEKLLDLDSSKDLHPPHYVNLLSGSTTYSSSSLNPLLEEFADELALIIFPSKYDDDLQFYIESDLKEIEYMFTMILSRINILVLRIRLIKGEKIKESKLLIDELDLHCNFLPSLEYDSILSEDFSRVDALPLTNNEDKDFDPPLYELPFFKEVPKSKMLLPFSFENEEKIFKPVIHTFGKVHSSLITELSHQGGSPSVARKRTPCCILTWEDLVSKFINEFFPPPSRTTNLHNEISNFQQRFNESYHEAWDRYKDLLRACPHHGFTKLHQLDTFFNALNSANQGSLRSPVKRKREHAEKFLRYQEIFFFTREKFSKMAIQAWDRFNDLLRACPHDGLSELHQLNTFYNALNVIDQDSLNSAAGGNFLDKMPSDCLKIIESKSKVRQSRAKAVVAKVNSSSSTQAISSDVAKLKDMVRALLLDKKNQSSAPATSPTPASVKAVESNFITCSGSRRLPGNTVTNPKDDLKGITTRSDVAYQGPTIPTPSKVVKQGTEEISDNSEENCERMTMQAASGVTECESKGEHDGKIFDMTVDTSLASPAAPNMIVSMKSIAKIVADDMSGDYVSGMDVDVNVSMPFAMAQAAYDGLQLEDQILKFEDVEDAYLSQEAVRCLFPGVHGRMTKLYRPTQKKYNLGVTVAMGRFMDDVVDNE